MKFADIIGHNGIKNTLREMIDSERIPHAIMIAGQSGIEKTLLARAYAQYIHCTNRTNGEPCGKCPACLQHQSLNHPDMHYVFPILKKNAPKRTLCEDYLDIWRQFLEESPLMSLPKWNELIEAGNSQPVIYVTESEEIVRKMSLSPYTASHKIMLIWQPERMNVDAANKLLKIIEEPYPDTFFIMVSNDPQAVLPTILSRVRLFSCNRLNDNEVAEYLTRKCNLPEDRAIELAPLAEGKLLSALQYASDSSEQATFSGLFKNIMRDAYSRKVSALKETSDSLASMGREKIRRFLSYCIRMVRENYIYNIGIAELNILTSDEAAFSSKFSPFIHDGNVEEMSKQIDQASFDIERNANAKIVLFNLMIHLMILLRKPKL
jgi:DNA polymerase-3 subunit delta'